MTLNLPLLGELLDERVLSAAENYHQANVHAAHVERKLNDVIADDPDDHATIALVYAVAGLLRAQIATAGGTALAAPEGASRQAANMHGAEALRVMAAHPGDAEHVDYRRGRNA